MSTTIKEDFEKFISDETALDEKEKLLKDRIIKEVLPAWFDYNDWERNPTNIPNLFEHIYVHAIREDAIYLDSCDRFENEIPTDFFLNPEKWENEKKLREEKAAAEKLEEEKELRERDLRALKILLDRHPDAYYWDEKELRIKYRY